MQSNNRFTATATATATATISITTTKVKNILTLHKVAGALYTR